MKIAGFLMLFAGWMLVVAALALLPSAGIRVVFLLAGLGVEMLGLVLAFRSHLRPKDE
jgi:small-conductance mechanosensitive channel